MPGKIAKFTMMFGFVKMQIGGGAMNVISV
jgi:hypothetical protein